MAINGFRWGVKPEIPGRWHATRRHDGFEIEIADEWIEARKEDDGQQHLQEARAGEIIQAIIQGIGLREKSLFRARLGSASRVDAQASRRDANVFVEGLEGKASVHADAVVIAADGRVVADSRADALEELLRFAESTTANGTLRRMASYLLEYYADPQKKLAPLFDIVELAREVFGNEPKAATLLGLSHQNFKSARRVMNDRTVRSGRHRGQELGPQRGPSPDESRLCEALAEQIVNRYSSLVRLGTAPR